MLTRGYVYMLTTASNTALYIGVTSDLRKRIAEHKNGAHPGSFTSRYNCSKLIYWNEFATITEAISEEKRLKGGNRKAKEALINTLNPGWSDLYDELY